MFYNKAGNQYRFFDAVSKELGPLHAYNAGPFRLPFEVGAGRRNFANQVTVFDKSGLNFAFVESVTASWDGDIDQCGIAFPGCINNLTIGGAGSLQSTIHYPATTSNSSPLAYPFSNAAITAAMFITYTPGTYQSFYHFANNGSEVTLANGTNSEG